MDGAEREAKIIVSEIGAEAGCKKLPSDGPFTLYWASKSAAQSRQWNLNGCTLLTCLVLITGKYIELKFAGKGAYLKIICKRLKTFVFKT
jgi:hypothetical protein